MRIDATQSFLDIIMMQLIKIPSKVLLLLIIVSCGSNDDFNDGPFVSKRKAITSFVFEEITPPVVATVDMFDYTVTAIVPFGTPLTSLTPTIGISEKATILPLSGTPQDYTSEFIYTVTAEDGSAQEWSVTVLLGDENAVPRLALSEPVWNLSPSGTGVPDFFTTEGERGLAFGNDHLYITNNNDKVLVLDPSDGSILSTLDASGIDGGEPRISDVEVSGNQIFACNTVEFTTNDGGQPTTFKIYRWETEASVPEVFLTYTNTEFRMGDSFTVVGDVNNRAIILTAFGRKFLTPASRGNKVFRWNVENGVVINTQPEIIDIQGVPSLAKFGSRPHAQLIDVDGEEYFVNANDIEITQTNLRGTFINRLPNAGRDLFDGFTSYFEVFEAFGKTIIISIFPRSSIESRLLVIDITQGIETVTEDDILFSENFMGTAEIPNVNASGAVTFNRVDVNNVDVYCLITNQALAKFRLNLSSN